MEPNLFEINPKYENNHKACNKNLVGIQVAVDAYNCHETSKFHGNVK